MIAVLQKTVLCFLSNKNQVGMFGITEKFFHIIGDSMHQSFFAVPLNIDAFTDSRAEIELSG